jgi:hypothetical protein
MADRWSTFNDPPWSGGAEMNNKYEAAEIFVVGAARETILGVKDMPMMDNRVDLDMSHRDDFQMFED